MMKSLLLSGVMFLAIAAAQAQELKPLNSDTEPDRIDWSQLDGEVRSLSRRCPPEPMPARSRRR